MKTIEMVQNLEKFTLRFKVSSSKPSRTAALTEQGLVTLAYDLAAKLEGEKLRFLCNERHYPAGKAPGMNPTTWSRPAIQHGNDCVWVNLEHTGAADFAYGCAAAAEVAAELAREEAR